VYLYQASPPFVIRQLLTVDARNDAAATVQANHVHKRRAAILIRIRKFKEAQHVFMPGLLAYLTGLGPEIDLTSRPEDISLHLPSSIPTGHRQSVCSPSLMDIEDQLRYAQAVEALAGLRRQLRTRVMASKLNRQDTPSQRIYLRSRALQDQVELRVRQWQRRYNRARAALLALRGSGEWERTLAVLKAEDVRGISERAMTAEEEEQHKLVRRMAGMTDESGDDVPNTRVVAFDPRTALGEGRRTLSWIWYAVSEQELLSDPKAMAASESCHWFSDAPVMINIPSPPS
jgi:hypothetical protein